MKVWSEKSIERLALLVAIVLPLFASAARAELAAMGQYSGTSDTKFTIGYYTEDTAPRIAIVGITGTSNKVAIAFEKEEWTHFVSVWQRARQQQSEHYRFIDLIQEGVPTSSTMMMIAAGPGVLFTINYKGRAYSFIMLPKDFASFDDAIVKVTTWLQTAAPPTRRP